MWLWWLRAEEDQGGEIPLPDPSRKIPPVVMSPAGQSPLHPLPGLQCSSPTSSPHSHQHCHSPLAFLDIPLLSLAPAPSGMDAECSGFFLGCVSTTTPALGGVFSGWFSLKCCEIPGWGSATPRTPLAFPAGPSTGWLVVSEEWQCTLEIHSRIPAWKSTMEIHPGNPPWKSGNSPWKPALEICPGNPCWKSTLENHPGNSPQKPTLKMHPGNLPWKFTTDFFLYKFHCTQYFYGNLLFELDLTKKRISFCCSEPQTLLRSAEAQGQVPSK